MKKFLLIICFLLFELPILAQWNKVIYYNSKDGLPHPRVYSTITDKKGRIWCGTEQGLALYTGKGFVPIIHNKNDKNSPLGGLMYALCLDQYNRIWCGTYRNGISIYEPEANTFIHLTSNEFNEVFYQSNLYYIQQGGKNNMLVYTSKGTFSLNTKTLKHTTLESKAIYYCMQTVKGKSFFLRESGQVDILKGSKIQDSIVTQKGQGPSMWMNVLDDQLFVSSRNGIYTPNGEKKLSRITIKLNGADISSQDYNGMLKDKDGLIYLNSLKYGVLQVVNHSDNTFYCRELNINNWYEYGNAIYSNYYDSASNSIFVGTESGLFKLSNQPDGLKEIVKEGMGTVNAIQPIKGRILLGTDDGVFEVKDNAIQQLPNAQADGERVFVHSFSESDNEMLATGQQMYRVGEKLTKYKFKLQSKPPEKTNYLCLKLNDSKQLIVMGGDSGRAVMTNNRYEVLKEYPIVLSNDIYPPIVRKTADTYLIKSYSKIYELNIRTGNCKELSLGNYMFIDLCYYKGRLYVSTMSKGIQVFNETYSKVDSIDLSKEGLSNQVYGIVARRDKLWFSSNNGFGYQNLSTKQIIFFSSGYIFKTTNFDYASKYLLEDTIFFGGTDGILSITPSVFIQSLKSTYHTSILFPYLYKKGVGRVLTAKRENDLSFDENNLEYQIVHTNYNYPTSPRYKYRIKADGPWAPLTPDGKLKLFNLPPDHYRIQIYDYTSNQIVAERTFVINPPWYQTWWFRIALILAIIANIIYITRLYYRRRIIAQQKELEKQKALQNERERISRDLHDDIGSGLSAMKLQAEYLESLPKDKWTKDNLHELVDESQELSTSMREIVWSLNTQYDNLKDFVRYVRTYAVSYFDKSSIELNIDVPMDIDNLEINGLKRRNMFLVYKEALHNVLKHSQATEVNVRLTIVGEQLAIAIKDNGKGFNTEIANGNGLQSMRYRMDAIKGQYELRSSKEGTETTFSVTV